MCDAAPVRNLRRARGGGRLALGPSRDGIRPGLERLRPHLAVTNKRGLTLLQQVFEYHQSLPSVHARLHTEGEPLSEPVRARSAISPP